MSTHDYEALGRAAVELGFEIDEEKDEVLHVGRCERGFPVHVPDFEDERTALACIPWLESVAREAWGGAGLSVTITRWKDGSALVWVRRGLGIRANPAPYTGVREPSLPHAALACVRAAREAA